MASVTANIDAAVQGLYQDAGRAIPFPESQLLAGRILAGAHRIRAKTIVDRTIESLDVELGINVAAKFDFQVPVNRFDFWKRLTGKMQRCRTVLT